MGTDDLRLPVTGLYILANISYLLVLLPSEILSTDVMAVSWG